MKVLLAKLLLEKPDILLLDEPTNYLDEEHISWLKRYLQEYENAFILISHDIPFLNSVINLIYHMENRKLTRYVGNYDKFMEVYEVQKAQLEAAYKRQQQEISELKDFVARNKARITKTLRLAVCTALGFMLAGLAVFQLIPDVLLGLFEPSAEFMAIGVRALRIICLHFPLAATLDSTPE